MFRQLIYFQSVVSNHSFSEAAEKCNISQSAISQQIKALEHELGIQLLKRENRTFTLTPAGDYFYRKSLLLTADYEQLCTETRKIAHKDKAVLRIGCLKTYTGQAFHKAVSLFTAAYPNVSLQITLGTHEELFEALRTESIDIVLNDQRRAFSSDYENVILAAEKLYVLLSYGNSAAELKRATVQDLKNIPCIIVSSQEQQVVEAQYYRDIIGIQSSFIYIESMAEAALMTIANNGFLLSTEPDTEKEWKAVPLYRNRKQLEQTYCAFWKTDNSGYYIEEFAYLLQQQFS